MEQNIQDAIDNGELIRSHLLRPTWHLVSAEDLFWMIELSALQIRATLKTRHKQLGLNEVVIKKCNDVIIAALEGNQHLTREELADLLRKIGITNDNNRLAHILLYAETEPLICSGRLKGNQQTYALIEERIKKPTGISKDEALKRLAGKYFQSRGPATLQDFKWWSGLSAGDARKALESVKSKLDRIIVGSETYWMGNSIGSMNENKPVIYLLPAYDEFIISYNDRSASLAEVQIKKKAISSNGIFRPVIISEGQVIGLWKRMAMKEEVLIECQLFKAPGKAVKSGIEFSAEKFGQFLNKKVQVKYI